MSKKSVSMSKKQKKGATRKRHLRTLKHLHQTKHSLPQHYTRYTRGTEQQG